MTALAELAALIREETGIALAPAQEAALRAAVERVTPGLGPEGFLRAAASAANRAELMSRLFDEVTVQETTFVRDREQFDRIGWRELAICALSAGRRMIRVWSAGCATGEEPYTLALLAAEAFAPAQPPVDVLGTDISGAALSAAGTGRYRPRAVRGLGPALVRRYFGRQADGRYPVGPQLRGLVRFRRHNLAQDPFPPPGEAPFDLVVCRNVLIYFAAPLAGRVIESFEGSLFPGGSLLLGATDALQRTTPHPALAPRQPGASAARPGPPEQHGRQRRRRDPAGPPGSRDEQLTAALAAADHGDPGGAATLTEAVLTADPLDADAYFIRGLIALNVGEPHRAVAALRRALYADATFALAAFTLGRAYDQLGDASAARRAYRQALGLLDPEDHRHELLLQQIDIGDIAAACRARLGG